ncbi:unnamed protein product [Tilletia laevis]|nr:unnamed protein product [Tilletia laevis]
MKQGVGFLSQLGIAWGNMNLSYPLSPWFTPKEDAEWLKEHRYWTATKTTAGLSSNGGGAASSCFVRRVHS